MSIFCCCLYANNVFSSKGGLRLTNAFSKKLENLEAAITLQVFWYDFVRVNSSIPVTPSMQAKISRHIWTWEELLNYQEQSEAP